MNNNEIKVFTDTGISVEFSNQLMGYFTLVKNYQGRTFFENLKRVNKPPLTTFTVFCGSRPEYLNEKSKKVGSFIDLGIVRLQKKLAELPDEYSETVVSEIQQSLYSLFKLIKGQDFC